MDHVGDVPPGRRRQRRVGHLALGAGVAALGVGALGTLSSQPALESAGALVVFAALVVGAVAELAPRRPGRRP